MWSIEYMIPVLRSDKKGFKDLLYETSKTMTQHFNEAVDNGDTFIYARDLFKGTFLECLYKDNDTQGFIIN